jgi:hypothetical protein
MEINLSNDEQKSIRKRESLMDISCDLKLPQTLRFKKPSLRKSLNLEEQIKMKRIK